MTQEEKRKLQIKVMVITLSEKYYETEGTGGCLHIVLDDGNYRDSDVTFCKEYSIKHKDYFGEVLATLLEQLTEEEREQCNERSWEVEEEFYNNPDYITD